MDVDDHHYAFTRSYGHNVIASLAGGHMVYNCLVWYKVLTDEDSRTVDRYTSHVTFSPAQRTCFMMCDTPHWLKCLHERVMSSSWSSMSCV